MLGHIENNRARHCLQDPMKFHNMLSRIEGYIQRHQAKGDSVPLHPTHKTEEEKRLLKNKRAKVARAKVKQTKLDLVKELSK